MTDSLQLADGWLLRTTLPATPESVSIARTLARGVLTLLAVDETRSADIALSVTEAASNAVRHAYEDSNGVFDLSARTDPLSIHLCVRDYGRGLGESDDPGMGIGLPMMWRLSEEFRTEPPSPAWPST